MEVKPFYAAANAFLYTLCVRYLCRYAQSSPQGGKRLIIESSASSKRDTESLVDGTDAHGYVVKDTITSTLLESIKVNGACIIRGNVSADNGLIHVIDKVLVLRFMIL
ncbi:MAG TPA: fasciclin domain-containing protein [Chloroflexota bacterium]